MNKSLWGLDKIKNYTKPLLRNFRKDTTSLPGGEFTRACWDTQHKRLIFSLISDVIYFVSRSSHGLFPPGKLAVSFLKHLAKPWAFSIKTKPFLSILINPYFQGGGLFLGYTKTMFFCNKNLKTLLGGNFPLAIRLKLVKCSGTFFTLYIVAY